MAPYTLMFPALLVLRRKRPETPRPYRVPGGPPAHGSAVVPAETFVLVGLVLFITVIPTGGSRLVYTAITSGGTLVTLLVGLWLAAAPTAGGGAWEERAAHRLTAATVTTAQSSGSTPPA